MDKGYRKLIESNMTAAKNKRPASGKSAEGLIKNVKEGVRAYIDQRILPSINDLSEILFTFMLKGIKSIKSSKMFTLELIKMSSGGKSHKPCDIHGSEKFLYKPIEK